MSALSHLWLGVIAATLAVMVNFPDWDLWARLAVGSVFLQTGGVLRQDIFAYTPTKPLWVDHEWGAGAVFYLVVRQFGETGLFVLKGGLIFALLALIARTIGLRAAGKPPAGVLYFAFLGLGLIYSVNHTVRAQLFSFVLFAAWLHLLERARRGGRAALWAIPVTMVAWVNLHGGFLAGLGLVAVYAVGEWLNGRSPLRYLGTLAAALLATLANPYGAGIWPFLAEAVALQRPAIAEWAPLSLAGPLNGVAGVHYHAHVAFLAFAAVFVLAGLGGLAARERPDWTEALLLGVTLWLGLRHQRHTVFFVIAAASLLHGRITALPDAALARLRAPWRGRVAAAARAIGRALAAAVVCWLLAVLARDLTTGRARLDVDPRLYPVGSLAFIERNRISGNLAVTFNWGSYALWKLYPGCRVMIDGRFEEVYPQRIYLLALDYSEHRTADWHRILRDFPPDVAVLPKAVYAPRDLAALPEWQRVYEDAVSVVLLPRSRLRGDLLFPDLSDARLRREEFSRAVDLSALSRH